MRCLSYRSSTDIRNGRAVGAQYSSQYDVCLSFGLFECRLLIKVRGGKREAKSPVSYSEGVDGGRLSTV